MTDGNQDAHGNNYITMGVSDKVTLRKEIDVDTLNTLSQEILKVSSIQPGALFDHYDYYAGGVFSAGGNISATSGGNTGFSGGGGAVIYSGGGAGGGGGGSYTVVPNGRVEGIFSPYFQPEPVDTEALVEKMVTRYVPGDGSPLVICVDNELTAAQMDEISQSLTRHNIEAVIIRGARAGTGRGHPRPVREECKRIDILAQLAETWERHPDLTFAELIRWWSGENMTDDDFAAATDVYAKKVYE